MKKKVLALLLATAMISTFVACGKEETPAADDNNTTVEDTTTGGEDTTEDEKITCTLTVWAPSEDQSDDNPWLQTQCEAFKAEHPNWDITFKYGVCAEGDAKSTVTQDVDAAADVFCYANDNLPDLISAGAIAKLGGANADFVKENFSQAYVDTVVVDGSIYGIPYEGNTWFMYYNKSVFTEEEVKSLDTMLAKDAGTVMFPLTNGWYNVAFYAATGAEFFGGVNNNDAGISFGADGVKATNYIVDLVANKNFKDGDFAAAVSGLADGSVVATTGGAWNRVDAEAALGENFAMCPVPAISIDGTSYQLKSFAGSKAFGVKATTEYMEVATALAVYLGGESAQMAKYEARGTIPAHTGVAAKLSDDALVKVINDVYAYASIAQPLCSNMGQWWGPAENMGKSIIAGEVTHENAAEKTSAFESAINGN